jgi:hypothetical protein
MQKRRSTKARTRGRKEKDMTDYDGLRADEQRLHRDEEQERWRGRGRAFWRWLKARPAESWLFLIAGVLTGKVLL